MTLSAGVAPSSGTLIGYARARGRQGGRPRSLSAEDLHQAQALLADPTITVEQVDKRLGVGTSTLYRHLPGGRSGVVADKINGDAPSSRRSQPVHPLQNPRKDKKPMNQRITQLLLVLVMLIVLAIALVYCRLIFLGNAHRPMWFRVNALKLCVK